MYHKAVRLPPLLTERSVCDSPQEGHQRPSVVYVRRSHGHSLFYVYFSDAILQLFLEISKLYFTKVAVPGIKRGLEGLHILS